MKMREASKVDGHGEAQQQEQKTGEEEQDLCAGRL